MSNNDTNYYKIILVIYLLGLLTGLGIFFVFFYMTGIDAKIDRIVEFTNSSNICLEQ